MILFPRVSVQELKKIH